MKNSRVLATCLIFALALSVAGCSDDPVKAKKDYGDRIPWPDMTDRDDVITTLLLCYANPRLAVSMEKYEALLHSGYYFVLDEDAVGPGDDPIITRAEDIEATNMIFQEQTMLELSIAEEGVWLERPDIGGDPCENCWETTRAYYIRAQFGADTVIYASPSERAFVTIVVAPNESDPSKWVIRVMYDLIS